MSDAYGKTPENGFCSEIASSKEDESILILKSYAFNMPMLRSKNSKTKTLGAQTFVVKNLNFEIGEKLNLIKEIKGYFSLSLKEAVDVVTALTTSTGVLIKSEEKLGKLCELLNKGKNHYDVVSGENQKTRVSL
jgi:ribosomal protein L7/L12